LYWFLKQMQNNGMVESKLKLDLKKRNQNVLKP